MSATHARSAFSRSTTIRSFAKASRRCWRVKPDLKLVAEASNGREAVEQFRTHRPDVTLMDLQMPEMNGVEAMIAIREEFPSARIIVLTTYAGDALVLRALKAGARAYLLKSLLRKELLGHDPARSRRTEADRAGRGDRAGRACHR